MIILGTDDPQALAVSHEFGPGVVPLDVVAGDYDGDGVVDLAFGGPDGARVFLGLGDGTFGEGSVLALGLGEDRQGLRHAADVDGDGVDELVVFVDGDNAFGVVDEVVGDPSFQVLMSSDFHLASTAADFNNDGILDFALFRSRAANLVLLISTP